MSWIRNSNRQFNFILIYNTIGSVKLDGALGGFYKCCYQRPKSYSFACRRSIVCKTKSGKYITAGQRTVEMRDFKIENITKSLRTGHNEALFSICIPTWNNLAYLQLCIESLRKNCAFRHQLIVHINDGSDGTLEWVTSQTDIDFSHSQKNISWPVF